VAQGRNERIRAHEAAANEAADALADKQSAIESLQRRMGVEARARASETRRAQHTLSVMQEELDAARERVALLEGDAERGNAAIRTLSHFSRVENRRLQRVPAPSPPAAGESPGSDPSHSPISAVGDPSPARSSATTVAGASWLPSPDAASPPLPQSQSHSPSERKSPAPHTSMSVDVTEPVAPPDVLSPEAAAAKSSGRQVLVIPVSHDS
jgi:hypothetical protein